MFKRFLKIVLSFFIILSIVPVDIYANNKNDSDEVKVDVTNNYVEIGNEYGSLQCWLSMIKNNVQC